MDLKTILPFCVLFLIFGLSEATNGKKLIVVLVDGCRWDYINDKNLKGIPHMIENGVRAPYVFPVYPSLSYPNYYSISTGLYPENHGFVHNVMYDAKRNASFLMLYNPGSTDAFWWNEAEPIWVTTEKNGLKTGLYWWAGCEVEIKGIKPTICEKHRYGEGTEEEKRDFIEKIEEIIEMFKLSIRPTTKGNDVLSVALMYYGPVDHNGHNFGPDSAENKRAVRDIDDILAEMQMKIKGAGLEDEVNIMVVSDHGMTELGQDITTYIDLVQFADDIKYQISGGANAMIVPEEGKAEKLYNDIKKSQIKGLRIYKKEDLPDEYHLRNSDRMSPMFLEADQGYYIKSISIDEKRIGGKFGFSKGTHGYNPAKVEDMRTIFVATGPNFRKGIETQVLYNVDYYNIMCHTLGINCLPNNGSWDRVKSMLVEDGPNNSGHVSRDFSFSYFLTIMIVLFNFLFFGNFIVNR